MEAVDSFCQRTLRYRGKVLVPGNYKNYDLYAFWHHIADNPMNSKANPK